MPAVLEITDYLPEMRNPLVALWRASFLQGVGAPVPQPEEEHRRFVDDTLLPTTTLRVALSDGVPVGFVSFTPTSVEQLYVAVSHHGQGIGTRLLDLAKQHSEGSLRLYTFASNTRAQRFYERHGFEILERGFEAVMQRPDILYGWKRHRLAPLEASTR
jgi:ribosomal protein S18 acetylase RimI-like enzyme